MSFIKDSQAAKNDEEIIKFLNLCTEVIGDGILNVKTIQSSKLFLYSKSFIIMKWEEDR